MNIDPLARIACRAPNTQPDWWAHDADPAGQSRAATLCMGCPAFIACDQYRLRLGDDAAGTYAAVYLPFSDVETDREFAALTAAMGWSDDAPTETLQIGDTGWTQLALWGPNVDARMLHTPPRRRRPRPGSDQPRRTRTADRAVTTGT